jgi:hypothetical protein
LSVEIKKAVTVYCFSLLFYICLSGVKKATTSIEELAYFTSPTFVAEKTKKEKENLYSSSEP